MRMYTTTQQTLDNFHNPIKRHMKDGYLIFRHDESIVISNSYLTAAIIKANDEELTIQVGTQGQILFFIANGITNQVTASRLNANTPINNQDAIRDFVISILDHINDCLVNQPAAV